MKPLLFCLALWMTACAYLAAAPLGPDELAAQLRQIQSNLDSGDASGVLAGLPAAWDVETPEQRYSISTQPLRSLLGSAGKDPSVRSDNIREAKQWLDHVAQQLESYSTAPSEAIPDASGKLTHILARPEFSGVHPPTAWDLFRERVAAWIASLIQRFFEYAAQHPTEGRFLFWVLLAGAVGLLALWLIRLWTRRDPVFSLPQPDPAVRSQGWEAWVRAARAAAGRGDGRQAIHCTYWAAVSRLQEMRALPQDLTRTPREYLRLISPPQTALAEPLTALTTGLERFWYAGRPANSDDFEASLKQLEALGCKLD